MRLGRTWTILIIAQVTFAVVILPPSVSSAWEDALDGMAGLGFGAEEYLSAQLGMDFVPGTGAAIAPDTPEFTSRFAGRQTELMRRLEAEPRVSSVTFAMFNPGNEGGARIEVEGERSETEVHHVRFNRVDVNFFRAFEVPILGGRGFEPADIALSEGGAVVVNQPFAQQILGGNALGRRIRYVNRGRGETAQNAEPGRREAQALQGAASRWYEIVGIVSDFPTGASPGMRDTEIKVYHAVAAGEVQPAAIAIRMRDGTASTFTQRLQEIALAVDPNLQLVNIRGLDELMRSEQWISRMTAVAFVLITVSVLMLSSAGIYALMSFTVSQRRKEIGIRIALGADRKRIVAGIFSRAFLQLAAGAALGLALGIAFERGSGGVIMRGHGAAVLPAVALVMMAVGFLAALGPARRSLRIEPTEALREE